jgi:hypothetical protein
MWVLLETVEVSGVTVNIDGSPTRWPVRALVDAAISDFIPAWPSGSPHHKHKRRWRMANDVCLTSEKVPEN